MTPGANSIEKSWSNDENRVSPSQPATMAFGVIPSMVPKLRPSGESPGIGGSENAIDVLAKQRFASSSETDRVRESASGLTVGEGDGEAVVRSREKRLKEKLKRRDG